MLPFPFNRSSTFWVLLFLTSYFPFFNLLPITHWNTSWSAISCLSWRYMRNIFSCFIEAATFKLSKANFMCYVIVMYVLYKYNPTDLNYNHILDTRWHQDQALQSKMHYSAYVSHYVYFPLHNVNKTWTVTCIWMYY